MSNEIRNTAEQLQREWDSHPRWPNITRDYTAENVVPLAGSVQEKHTLALVGSTEEGQFNYTSFES